ncbi:MAG: hypothetical protein KME29_02925 [Calothrix sp. FI2-JRJ7]|nr:hypothetical protein [Calothrix sp. FI2-JRJ7]
MCLVLLIYFSSISSLTSIPSPGLRNNPPLPPLPKRMLSRLISSLSNKSP